MRWFAGSLRGGLSLHGVYCPEPWQRFGGWTIPTMYGPKSGV